MMPPRAGKPCGAYDFAMRAQRLLLRDACAKELRGASARMRSGAAVRAERCAAAQRSVQRKISRRHAYTFARYAHEVRVHATTPR